MQSADRHLRTLFLATVLHGFTHVYQVALVPLYLPITQSLKLSSVGQATLLVTVLYLSYFLPSYPLGVLADRFSKKKLLAWGLAINALGFVGLSFANHYTTALLCVVVAGIGGSFFHPAATALVARLYPGRTGRALGIVGIGASIGFFFGPMYTGWRAFYVDWHRPVLELGIAGVVAALMFAWLAEEEAPEQEVAGTLAQRRVQPMFPAPALWIMFLGAAFAFSLRDFAGSSMGTLSSLFLQQARGFDVKQTGMAISFIFIASAISNPLFGHLSDRGRLKWAGGVLAISAALAAAFPHLPRPFVIPALLLYGFFFMANYPIVEAALMDSVPNAVRGRVFGLFITIGGFIGNLSHWIMGHWVETFGTAADRTQRYFPIYLVIAGLLVLSLPGLLFLRGIRRREAPNLDGARARTSESNPRTPS